MAGTRCRFPTSVKRLTVKLIESFKVIGIDNAEVNKRQQRAVGPSEVVEGFAPAPEISGRASRDRDDRGGTSLKRCSL